MPAILFDLDGVIYQGEHVIDGAPACIRWCREQGIPHLFLTNTTSRPRSALVHKLAGYGIEVEAARILTPPVAAAQWLQRYREGPVALFVPEATAAEFTALPLVDDEASEVAAVVLGDLGEGWDFRRLNRAFRLLMAHPGAQLVALGMPRYWQAHDGLRLDVGPFVSALAYAAGREPVVLGKPSAQFFQAALDRLGVEAGETVMIGDDIRGDIEGAQAAGLLTLLVRTGKFRPGDLALGIEPTALLESVAGLPAWWQSHFSARD